MNTECVQLPACSKLMVQELQKKKKPQTAEKFQKLMNSSS